MCLTISTRGIIEHVRLYGQYTQVFSIKKDAITKINTVTAHCCRNSLNGFLKTELITCVNNSDQVIYISIFTKVNK